MKYSLRTLVIAVAIAPPLLAAGYYFVGHWPTIAQTLAVVAMILAALHYFGRLGP